MVEPEEADALHCLRRIGKIDGLVKAATGSMATLGYSRRSPAIRRRRQTETVDGAHRPRVFAVPRIRVLMSPPPN